MIEMREFIPLKDIQNLNITSVKQFKFLEKDRPEFQNRYLKIFFFLYREGIFRTIRKYRAHKEYQNQYEYLTFLVTEVAGTPLINVSVQSSRQKEDFVIENRFFPFKNMDFEKIGNNAAGIAMAINQFSQPENFDILDITESKALPLELKNNNPPNKYNDGLFVFGLGGYLKMYVISHFRQMSKIACVDYKAGTMQRFKSKYNFKHGYLTPLNALPLLQNTHEPAAIIATYHADHASLASKIFEANSNTKIFIEKPATVTLNDLSLLIQLFNRKANIEFGFNRRFIKYSRYVKEFVKDEKIVITCSVKEVLINPSHWYLWKNQGTRITGNGVHWIDLANWWIEADPVEINILAPTDNNGTTTITVLYQNGSLLNLLISDIGNSLRGVQEKIEVRFNNQTIFIDDFLKLTHLKEDGRCVRKRSWHRDKGHDTMYKNFNKIILGKKKSEYSVYDLIRTSLVTYYASYMLENNIRNMNIESELKKYYQQIQP